MIIVLFNQGEFSHAIRKGALLAADGTVYPPDQDFRSKRIPSDEELEVAESALITASEHLQLNRPLLYARIDLVKGEEDKPLLLEMEIAEPSLSLPFDDGGATRFARALTNELSSH